MTLYICLGQPGNNGSPGSTGSSGSSGPQGQLGNAGSTGYTGVTGIFFFIEINYKRIERKKKVAIFVKWSNT